MSLFKSLKTTNSKWRVKLGRSYCRKYCSVITCNKNNLPINNIKHLLKYFMNYHEMFKLQLRIHQLRNEDWKYFGCKQINAEAISFIWGHFPKNFWKRYSIFKVTISSLLNRGQYQIVTASYLVDIECVWKLQNFWNVLM